MTPTIIDRDGRSTTAAAEAQAALAVGDTLRAREKFEEAGLILERELRHARGDEDAHLLRFLAATQFFKGGHYQKAHDLAGGIEVAKLPPSARPLLPRFMQDVKERASPDYEARVRTWLDSLWAAKDYVGLIEALQEHPYVLSPANLAFLRAVCCEMLGKYRQAVLFFADAARRAPDDPAVLAALAPLPLTLAGQGRLQEAWEYARAQIELFPNAVSYAVASLLCYHRAHQGNGEDGTRLLKEQIHYFERARDEYALLPPAHQNHPEIRAVMGLGYEAAAFALSGAGDKDAARKMCDAAIAFDPASPNAWTILGVITFGSEEAARAFNKAVELGDRTYFPYYYLAYDAVTTGNFQAALDWSRRALELGERQDAQVKSLLYQWSAISMAQLGAARNEVETLFQKAIEAAPDNVPARENYRRFQASERLEPPPLAAWDAERERRVEDRLIRDQEMFRFQPHGNADQISTRLAVLDG